MLVVLPLVVLPMAPGVELTLGNSLIPVTGVMLLLRSLLEGNLLDALRYAAPVALVTLLACLLAIRWAVDQFNSENVLFRESERFDLATWVHHLLRDRADTPNVAAAMFCGLLILMLRFFAGLVMPEPQSFDEMARATLLLQIGLVATPALIMTIMLTRSPRATLQLNWPRPKTLLAVLLLAPLMHPIIQRLGILVSELYPVDLQMAAKFETLFKEPSLGWLLLVAAVAPAICEELTFRGFVLSGLRHLGSKWQAILISSAVFGITHQILQQSILASLTGAIIGYIAIQSSSIFPGMLYHFVHNALPLLLLYYGSSVLEGVPGLRYLGQLTPEGFVFDMKVAIVCAVLVAVILRWFHRLPHHRTAEEVLHDAIKQQNVNPDPLALSSHTPGSVAR
jgi:sodium transport system permease protein